MATTAERLWMYDRGDGEPPVVDLLLDQSLASAQIESLFREQEIPCRVSQVEGIDDDRPAIYIADEGPGGRFLYGAAEISFYFLSRFRPRNGNAD